MHEGPRFAELPRTRTSCAATYESVSIPFALSTPGQNLTLPPVDGRVLPSRQKPRSQPHGDTANGEATAHYSSLFANAASSLSVVSSDGLQLVLASFSIPFLASLPVVPLDAGKVLAMSTIARATAPGSTALAAAAILALAVM